MQWFIFVLAGIISQIFCKTTVEHVQSDLPFCRGVQEETNSLVEEFGSKIGVKSGREFITCTLTYWGSAFFGGRDSSGTDFTFLLNPETGKLQSAYSNHGSEIFPNFQSDVLEFLKEAYQGAPKDFVSFDYFTDDFFNIGGARLVREVRTDNLVMLWGKPLWFPPLKITIPNDTWVKEEQFLRDVNRIYDHYNSVDE